MKCYNCGPGPISETDTKQLCVRCALVWMFDPDGKLTWRNKDAVIAGVHALIDKAESVTRSLTERWRDATTPAPQSKFSRDVSEAETGFIDEFARYFARRKPATEPLYPTTGEGSTVTVTPPLRYRPGDQPLPIPNQHQSMHDLVTEDLQARKKLGLNRYGSLLQPFNGRSFSRDAYEELLDMMVYWRGKLCEEEHAILKPEPETQYSWLYTDPIGDVWRLTATLKHGSPFTFEIVSRA